MPYFYLKALCMFLYMIWKVLKKETRVNYLLFIFFIFLKKHIKVEMSWIWFFKLTDALIKWIVCFAKPACELSEWYWNAKSRKSLLFLLYSSQYLWFVDFFSRFLILRLWWCSDDVFAIFVMILRFRLLFSRTF